MRKPRVVVSGFVGLFPFGGVIWDYVQYVAGFAKLGCDVIYLEDTGAWPVYQNESDASYNVAHVAAAMDHGSIVITNLDEWSPPELVHMENVIDIRRCDELPLDPLVDRKSVV